MSTARARTLLLGALVIVALAACQPASPSPSTMPSTAASVSPGPSMAGQACVTFKDLTLHAEIGTPSGLTPGALAFTEDGVSVSVEHFEWTTGPGTMDFFVVMESPDFGDGQFVFVNNINLVFDFTGLGFRPQRVTLHFRDQGGNENISINDDPSPPLADDITAFPSPLGGVNFVISPLSTVNPQGVGDAEFRGTVDTLLIGGQELSLDDVCAFAS